MLIDALTPIPLKLDINLAFPVKLWDRYSPLFLSDSIFVTQLQDNLYCITAPLSAGTMTQTQYDFRAIMRNNHRPRERYTCFCCANNPDVPAGNREPHFYGSFRPFESDALADTTPRMFSHLDVHVAFNPARAWKKRSRAVCPSESPNGG